MKIRKFLTLASTLLLAGPGLAQGAEKRFRLDDIARIQDVGAPSISRDGQRVAYTLTTINTQTDAYVDDIWVVPYAGGAAKNLTATPDKSESAPQFSPDGRWISYLADGPDDSGTQLFLMRVDGSDKRQVGVLANGVNAYSWSPDGSRIVFTAFAGGAKPNAAGTPPPIEIDRFQFKEDWVGYLRKGERRQLHLLDVTSGKVVQLTSDNVDHWLPAWSPDGKWIAFVSKQKGDADRNMDSDVYIMKPEVGGETRRVSTSSGTDVDPYWASPPAWSPDGKRLVWLTSGESKWIYYAPWQLTVADIDSGAVREVARIDRNFYQPKWSADGKSLYSLIEQDRVTHLAKIDVASGAIQAMETGLSFSQSFDVSADDRLVVQTGTDDRPLELLALGATSKLLTSHNRWLDDYTLGKTEEFTFDSDGHRIGGLIVYPPHYDDKKKYPAIFRLHGGPVYQFSHEFMFDWQVYAAEGYIVVGINPRGSSGKGFDFSRAIYADWGNLDVKDILAGADHLSKKGIIDAARLGVGGWSYGGILTDYVIASDNRFKAAVSGAGAINMFASYGHDQYAREYELELGTPWRNFDTYRKLSYPLFKADSITTPTLFKCAEKDFNVPCLGAEQMYQALRSSGVPTNLVVYPGQNHGITVPSYMHHRVSGNLDWYDRFLKAD